MAQPGVTGVLLTVTKGKTPKGFPRGEVLNEVRRHGVVERTSSYSAEKVLKWLVVHKLIDVTFKDGIAEITDLSGEGHGALAHKGGAA